MGQDNSEKQPLFQILQELQQQYEYKFNYVEETIIDVYIKPPPPGLSFQKIIDYLNSHTGLIFKIIDSNFVSVKKPDGQTICGFIKSKETKVVLASATITAESNSIITDENGFFSLTIQSRNELIVIRHLGFRTTVKNLTDFDKNECIDIFLDTELQSLSEVVISNYIANGISKLNDGSFEIDFSNFDILPGLIEADVLQSVQAFPGIQSENETVSNINIRGGSHDQNLILWDDIKMYQSGHFFGLISMFHPQITQSVSLLKNGTDVRYSDGTSGTILMQTQENVNSKFSGTLGVNFLDANGFVDVPLGDKSSIQIAARKSVNDVFTTPTYNQFFERISQNTEVENNTNNTVNSDKSFDFYDTSLRWVYNFSPKDEIRVNFINVANELLFNENAMVNDMEESRQSKVSQNSIAGGLQYKRTWNDRWQSIFSIYETDYKLEAVNANILESQRFLQENKVSETSIKLSTFFRINPRFQLFGGHHVVETQITNLDDVDNPLFRLLVSEVIRTYATFTQLNYASLDRKTNFSIGGRYNYIDKFKKSIIEPRLNFNHRFLKYFTVEVLGEFKHQNTSQVINVQNDFLGIEKRRWQLSNDNEIPVIESKQASVGINFNQYGWLLSAEGYFKQVKGITSQSQGFQNQYEFEKTQGQYDVKGVDMLLRKRFGNFNTWLSYSYMDNQYEFDDLQETNFPSNFDVEHAMTLGLTYIKKNLKVATGLNWHTGKPTTNPDENNQVVNNEINYQAANSNILKDYLRIDMSASYDFKVSRKTNATIGFSIWNILDTENPINTTYKVNNGNPIKVEQNSLGLTPNFLLRVFF